MPPSVVVTVVCGLGKFTLDTLDVITQYDHLGRVVGILSASSVPNLRAWMVENKRREVGGTLRVHGPNRYEVDED